LFDGGDVSTMRISLGYMHAPPGVSRFLLILRPDLERLNRRVRHLESEKLVVLAGLCRSSTLMETADASSLVCNSWEDIETLKVLIKR
jgi:hypothetical protein